MNTLFAIVVALCVGMVQHAFGVDPGVGNTCDEEKNRCSQLLPTMDLYFEWPVFNTTTLQDFCTKYTEVKTCAANLKNNSLCSDVSTTLEAELANAAYFCGNDGRKIYQDNLACFTESSMTSAVDRCYRDILDQAFLPPSSVDGTDPAVSEENANETCKKLNEFVNCTGAAFSPCRSAARDVATMTAQGLHNIYKVQIGISLGECSIATENMVTMSTVSMTTDQISGSTSWVSHTHAHVATGLLTLIVATLS